MALAMLGMSCANNGNDTTQKPITKPEITIEGGRMTPEALWAMGRIGSVVRNSETGLLAYTVSYYSVEENRSSTWIRICQHGDELKVLDEFVGSEPAWLGIDNALVYLRGGKIYIRQEGKDIEITNSADIEGFLVSPKQDKIVIINYYRNTPYGCCIDRGSKVTIVFTSGNSESCTSWLAYHIAKMGGFNYVSKEVETDLDNPTSYFNIPNSTKCPNLPLFLEDVQRLASRPDSWVISVLAASGPLSRPTQLHFCYNTKKHDDSYSDPASRIKDYDLFDKLYRDMSESIETAFGYKSDKNEWYAIGSQNFIHKIECRNSFNLRVEAYLWMSDNRFMSITKEIADSIHRVLEPEVDVPLPPEMVTRHEGHDFGMQDYVD